MPTTSPTTMIGAQTSTSVTIASRATSRTSGPVIDAAPPAASWHTCPSDRHPHHFFVGLDHTIAHRHEGLHGDLGFGDGGDHVHQIGLAGGGGLTLDVGLAARLDDRADHVLEHL